MKLSETINQFLSENHAELDNFSTPPPRYHFGEGNYWRLRMAAHRDGEIFTSWVAQNKESTHEPNFAEAIQGLVRCWLTLREFGSSLQMSKEFHPNWERMEVETWEEYCKEDRRSWAVMREYRTRFIEVFGRSWYIRLMSAEDDF